ncbi:ROK family transcriptional regulator [Streptomyces sp. SID3343]|uniref:ROK family transcriptional regulator n=1 Tax=Streptomyces sp. SID3343 TaxID=2690260 RepID=UPI00136B4B15|nr:ROK family transcriptional regulator [Streptomyces sp. SID3343]MYW02157.1 ROK family protein [Streptomyces sp. SID3343]
MAGSTDRGAGASGREQAGRPSLLRAINDRAALELLLRHGRLSRGQIGSMTGLSKPTASQLLSRLEAAGLVLGVGTTEGGRGPGAQLYELNPAAGHVAGLDVTPARIKVAIADLTGHVVGEYELPTSRKEAADTPSRISEAVRAAAAPAGLDIADLAHIVIGIPGAFDPTNEQFRYGRHLAGWHSPGVLDKIRAEVGVTVDVENDVNLAAIAEQRDGTARDGGDFVLLWVDEGIGCAIVLGARLHRGSTGGAGEVGYMPLPGAPLPHDVGRRNTGGFQQLAGAPAVLSLARAYGVGSRSAAQAVARAVRSTDTRGGAFLDELAHRLAVGLAVIVSVLDPGLVVLSGAIPLAGGEALRTRVVEDLHRLAIARPRVLLGNVPDDPVLAGAVHAALDVARDVVFTTA